MAGEQSTSTDDTNLSSLVSSSSLVLVGSLFGASSKLIEQAIIGHTISTVAYGKVNVGIAMMMLCSTFAMVGFNEGIPRFMSRFDDERDERGIWISGIIITGIVAVVIALAISLNSGLVNRWMFPKGTPMLLPILFAVTIPFYVGLRVAVSAIRGHENTIYRTYTYDLLYNGLRIGLLLVLLFAAGVGVLAAGYAYIIAAAVALVAAHFLLNRLLSLRGPFRTHTESLVRFSAPLVVASTVSALLAQVDKIMLGALANPAATGVYSYGYTLAAGVPVVLSIFGFLYLPLASRLDADENHTEVNRLYKVTTKWIYIAAFPMFLTFVAFSNDLVSAIFPKSTPESAAVLAILSIGFFVSAANGRCQDTLSAFGYTRIILVVNTIAAVLNIVLNIVLIRRYGVVGAALASALSFFTLNALAMVVLWKTSGISPFSRLTVRTFVLLPVILLPPALLLSRTISLSLFALPVFAVLVGLVSVVLVAVTGCLQPEDEIPVELVEDRLGVRIPLIRRYIPARYS